MRSSHIDVFTKWRQAREVIDAVLLRGEGARQRAAQLAEMLQFLWPGEALSACLLRGGEETYAAALDEAGAARPEWAALLRDEATRRAAAGDDGAASRTTLLQAVGLPGFLLAWEDVRCRERCHGALVLAVPEDGAPDSEAVRSLLAACAQHLAAGLEIEALESDRAALAEEAAGNARLADVGEVSAPVVHEFNNFLNALLLHTAVLKYQLPEGLHPGVEEMRRQALAAAAMIQQFQHYRQRRRPAPLGVDLNGAVRGAVEALGGRISGRGALQTKIQPGGVPVRIEVEADELLAPGPLGDVKRLCVFLIRNAAGAAAANGAGVVVRTSRVGDKVVLRVEDAGPALPPEMTAHFFEPSAAGRDGTSPLELAACKALARRLQGSIRAENRAEGGAAIVVVWDAGKTDPE